MSVSSSLLCFIKTLFGMFQRMVSLHLAGSHNGALCEEILMMATKYTAKKKKTMQVLVNSSQQNEGKTFRGKSPSKDLASLKEICSQISLA